jgi:hypothetical protein
VSSIAVFIEIRATTVLQANVNPEHAQYCYQSGFVIMTQVRLFNLGEAGADQRNVLLSLFPQMIGDGNRLESKPGLDPESAGHLKV